MMIRFRVAAPWMLTVFLLCGARKRKRRRVAFVASRRLINAYLLWFVRNRNNTFWFFAEKALL